MELLLDTLLPPPKVFSPPLSAPELAPPAPRSSPPKEFNNFSGRDYRTEGCGPTICSVNLTRPRRSACDPPREVSRSLSFSFFGNPVLG